MSICSSNSLGATTAWFRGCLPSSSSKPIPTARLPFFPTSVEVNPPSLNPSFPQHSQKLISEKKKHRVLVGFIGAGFAIALNCAFPSCASAAEFPFWDSSIFLREPENALSLPTWAIHVSSVVEWITAMALVWKYGDRSGYESWKGLSWGMMHPWRMETKVTRTLFSGTSRKAVSCYPGVPLLGGAFCACTWHFYYNSESLEVLVALQAALTVIGNLTMCIAAFRIYKSTQEGSENT